MSARAEELAAKVEQSFNDLLAAVEASTPEQWASPCTDPGWTQAVAGFHAATAVHEVGEAVADLARGGPFPQMTMDELDAKNAVQAKEHADCTVSEVAGIIRESAGPAVKIVRSLTDEQLDMNVKLLAPMPEVSLEMFVQLAMVGHATYHLGTIKGARS